MSLNYFGHSAAARSLDSSDYLPIRARSSESDAWRAVLRRAGSGSTGVVLLGSAAGLFLLPVSSSSSIVDSRSVLTAIEQVQELQAALSLDKTRLARILCVTRPTLYGWLQGREPNQANAARLETLMRILEQASVSSASPLNTRFVARSLDVNAPSLFDLLCEETIDEKRVVPAMRESRTRASAAARKRLDREERLRALGFEEPDGNQRRRQLATSVALRKWPEASSRTT